MLEMDAHLTVGDDVLDVPLGRKALTRSEINPDGFVK